MRTTVISLCVLLLTLVCWAGEARAQDTIAAEIEFTNTPPVLDGVIQDDPAWAGVEEHDTSEFFTVGGEDPTDDADLSVTWKAMWDLDNLYVAIEVLDIDIVNADSCNWEDDSAEIYIDARNLDSTDYTPGANEAPPDGVPAYQFTALAGDRSGCERYAEDAVDHPSPFSWGINSYDPPDPDFQVTQYPQEADTGASIIEGDVFYTVEVAFPWGALEESIENILARDGEFGFGIAINDDDDGGGRDTQIMWATEAADLWMRSDTFPSVQLIPPDDTGPLCDFDGNATCDVDDLDSLLHEGQSQQILDPYDLNSDGVVNLLDRDEWYSSASAENGVELVPGDTNLDGLVVASDLNDLGTNWQRTDATSIAQGDFNGDGLVAAADLNDTGLNWQHGVAAAAGANAVPEPATPCWLVLGLLCLLRRSWQRRN